MTTPGDDDPVSEPAYVFYRLDPDARLTAGGFVDAGYSWTLWRPSMVRCAPSGVALWPYGIAWWLMHHLRVFRNRDFGILAIYEGRTLVHHTVLFPPYLRFPFMGRDDINLGETWTHPAHRGRGLATFAIHQAVRLMRRSGRRFWYVHREGNEPSGRAIRRTGFPRVGLGVKRRRWGSNTLGYIEFLGS